MKKYKKNLWDAEDRLRTMNLSPENDADKPLVAIYTYDAGGERTIKYVPARIDARYSAKEAGSADRLEAMIYPSALLTAKILPIPEEGYGKGGRRVLKYTKHYYIGSERIASFLGTKQSVGLYCTSETTLIPPMDAKVLEAGDALGDVFAHFDKTIDLDTPYLYGSNSRIICAPAQITQGFGAYWYHPDHLGSSSYITNLNGEISQHMEYLPFGETLVEDHLNSNNSPYKFNAKEFDSETGNYYYGARYYSPKYNLMLSVDQMYELYPSFSPYAYTLQNPVRYVDPTGMFVESADHEYEAIWNKKTKEYDTTKISDLGKDNYDITHYKGGKNDGRTEISNSEGSQFIRAGADVINGFTHRSDDVNWKDIFDEFVDGTGPKRSLFDDTHPMTEDMKNSFAASIAREFYAMNKEDKGYIPVDFGLSGIIKAGSNMTEQMVGSVGVSVYPLGKKVVILLTDTKSPRSLFYHLPNLKSRYNRDINSRNIKMPYSETKQTYIWIESINQ